MTQTCHFLSDLNPHTLWPEALARAAKGLDGSLSIPDSVWKDCHRAAQQVAVSSDEGFSWMDAPAETVELYDVNKDVQSSGRYIGRYGLARIATYYGAPRGIARLRAFGEIIDAVPGETVSISREIMPGFSYVPGTLRTRQLFILEVRRAGDMVELLIEDQYSIEEAGGF